MSGILNDEFYAVKNFQAWCMGLGNRCYNFDLDLAGYAGRKPKNGYARPPQIVCLFEAKCVDPYPNHQKVKPDKFTGGGDEFTKYPTEAIQALAKAAGLPLFLIAYKHYADERPLNGSQTFKDIEHFGVALLYPEAEEKFTWYTPEGFKKWQYETRKTLAAVYAQQEAERHRVYAFREKTIWPAIKQALGLPDRPPWLSPAKHALLPDSKKSRHICADEDPPAVTDRGISLAPRREGRKHAAKKVAPGKKTGIRLSARKVR